MKSVRFIVLTLVLLLAGSAWAQAPRWDIGIRGGITAADGEPANDIPSWGVFVRYQLSTPWSLGIAVEQGEYDFEEPARLLGLEQEQSLEPIDVIADSTVISAWMEREHRSGQAVSFFWGGGAGIASVDVPDAAGPLEGGGTFDITTDAGQEFMATALAGVRWNLSSRWLIEFAVRADQHFADWELTDRVSGRTGSVDDYLAVGGYIGTGFRF
jgi:hypothetical protein